MNVLFYVSGATAILSALIVVTRRNAAHAIVFLVMLFLSIASVFMTLGAPLAAVLQIVVYAGAIIVLFVFVVMMLNEGRASVERERRWTGGLIWLVPVVMCGLLLVQISLVLSGHHLGHAGNVVGPKAVGISLFTQYLIGVELAGTLLLSALVAAFHFGVFSRIVGESDE